MAQPPAQEAFDPWRQWLGIDPSEQPADHYRVLGLPPREADVEKIKHAADERMKRVRAHQTGPRAAATQEVLTRLAAARACLTNPATKASYDAVLEAQLAVGDGAVVQSATGLAPPAEAEHAPPVFIDFSAGGQRTAAAGAARRARTRPLKARTLFAVGVTLFTAAAAAWTFRDAWWPARSEEAVAPAAPPLPPVRPKPKGGRSAAKDPRAILRYTAESAKIDADRKTGGVLDMTLREGRVEATWDIHVARPGFYMVVVTYATSGEASQVFEIELSTPARVSAPVRANGGLDTFVTDDIKTVAIRNSGDYRLTLRAAGAIDPARTIRVKEVLLRPEYLPKPKLREN